MRFGLVLAGEMLYARANHLPLLDFLALHLAPGGRALLADKGRFAAEGFPEMAAARGFAVDARPAAFPAVGGLPAGAGRIYTLAPNAPGP